MNIFFERDEEELLPQFRPLYLLLAAQQVHGVLGADAQQLAHAEEAGLLVVDDAAVGRHAQLAIGEGVERVDGLVGRHARRQVHLYFHLFGREVVRLAYLDFALLAGADDALDELARGSAVGDFADDKRLVVQFAYLGAYLHHAAPARRRCNGSRRWSRPWGSRDTARTARRAGRPPRHRAAR